MARFPINESAFGDERLRAVADFLQQHVSDAKRLSLPQAAAIANLCPESFCRLFRRHVGITFIDWQRLFWMEHARCLILDRPSRTSAAVAPAATYENPTTFGRAFKRVHGITPGQLRRLMMAAPELKVVLSLSARLDLVLTLVAWGARNHPTLPLFTSLAQRLAELCSASANR